MHQKYKSFGNVTGGRLFINKYLLPRLANEIVDGSKVLFVGVHKYWDYSCLFNNPGKLCVFETLDKHPGAGDQPKPTYNASIEDCKETIPDESYDLVIMIGVYEFLDHKKEAFSEINRILRPGGKAMLSLPGSGYYPNSNNSVEPHEVFDELNHYK